MNHNPNADPVRESDARWPICADYIITKWAIEAHRNGKRQPVNIQPGLLHEVPL